jgi:ubiquinol-cytochrome c reductase cytochrome c subunit
MSRAAGIGGIAGSTLPLLGAALLAAGSAGGAAGPVGIVAASSGAGLYAANCSSCHGPRGRGVPPPGRAGVGDVRGEGPSLRGVGAGTVDLYLRTGLMPLADPRSEPWRSQVLLSPRQIAELVAFVAAFAPGPAVPRPDPARGSLAAGFALFAQHCAGCHQVAGAGGYVTGARVPALTGLSDVEIAEAVRAGPYVMPKFSAEAISNLQLDSIVRYLDYSQHPLDAGGLPIGRIGPVPEGLVAWLVGAAGVVALCALLGRRARRG